MYHTDYSELIEDLRAMVGGVPHRTANLANISALLYERLGGLNWAGFYFLEKGQLVLGPFQGRVACVEIPMGAGVCGTAAKEDRTVLVPDVHKFDGHIACDSASNSEIVVPLRKDGKVVGVLDLDSPEFGRFTEEDAEGLQEVAHAVEEIL